MWSWNALLASLGLAALLTACGSAENSYDDLRAETTSLTTPAQRLVVVRHDFNGDRLADILTLDALSTPMRVVEAMQGLRDGSFLDASSRWRGRVLDEDIDLALQCALDRSCAVGAATTIDVPTDGRLATLQVVE